MDTLSGSFEEYCAFIPEAQVQASKLYAAYKGWCEENGHRPMSQTSFRMKIKERSDIPGGVKKVRNRMGQYAWSGIGLRVGV